MDFYRALSAKKDVLSIIQCSSARKNRIAKEVCATQSNIENSDPTDLLTVDFTSTPCKRVLSSPAPEKRDDCCAVAPYSPGLVTTPTVKFDPTASTAFEKSPESGQRTPFTQLQLEPESTDPPILARSVESHGASTNDDDAFEQLLAKLRRSPSPKFSSRSSSSFFTENSSSGSDVSDEQLLYHQLDNADRAAKIEAENRLPIRERIFPLLEQIPTKDTNRKVDSTAEVARRQTASTCDLPKSVKRSEQNGLEVRSSPFVPCRSRAASSTGVPIIADFVCSLYALDGDTAAFKGRRRHPSAERYVKLFKANRVELAQRLFRIFNEKVFDRQLPEDLSIIWNTRLLRTAGQCKYLRREVIPRNGERTITRIAQIELSPKVCTTAERVRDTLLHEACHAAVWIVDGINDGHGPRWRRWANRAMQIWPELPVVSVCHAYNIHTRFTYRCTGCGVCVNRHSKSINTEKQICGHCRSRFELLINTPRGRMMRPSVAGAMDKRLLAHCANRPQTQQSTQSEAVESNTMASEKRRPVFAEFVREHYRHVRQNPEIRTHAEAMSELGSLFKTMRVSNPKQQPDSTS